jgi:ABC-type sugar transport system, permease component
MKKSRQDVVFQTVDIVVMILITLTIVLPFMHIFSVSISSDEAVKSMSVGFLPKGFNFSAYNEILNQKVFFRSLTNTVFITVITTGIALLVNFMAAYAFSKDFFGKKVFTYFFVLTMYFSGGLIPTFILMTNWLHLTNNFLAFILPSIVNVFYIIIIRSQIEAIPKSLSEAAVIDGANEFQVMTKIILPTMTATIAAIGMFVALNMWNMWYPVMLYSNRKDYWSLQYYLRSIVFEKLLDYDKANTAISVEPAFNPQNYQMAAIVLVALPIVAIYPFIQKYFVKGILVGAVKE